MPALKLASDTITVTTDGRTIVDTRRLMKKDHIRAAIQAMQSKTVVVYKKRDAAPALTTPK
jgi:hypothetical protein